MTRLSLLSALTLLLVPACSAGSDSATGTASPAGAGGSSVGAGGSTAAGGSADGGSSVGGSAAGGGSSTGGASAGGASAGGSSAGGASGGSGGSMCVQNGGAERLSVTGPDILGPDGNKLLLRGWNWGQWGYDQPNDAMDNAAQGANVVRIPLRWWGVYEDQPASTPPDTKIDSRSDGDPGHIEPMHLKRLDDTIHALACAGLWIDLFVDSNCGQASPTNGPASYCETAANGQPKNFTNDPASAEIFTQVWEFLVDRYKSQPRIAMYELLPEPQMGCVDKKPCDWTAAPTFYSPLIDRVRKIDQTTPLLIGADSGYDIAHIDTAYLDKPGLIYTGDFLSFGSSHPEWVAQYAQEFRQSKMVPVFIQQVGVKHTDTDAMNRLTTILGTLSSSEIGWTWWTYREKGGDGSGFAPYWVDKTGNWASDTQWLAWITANFH